jgi:hypothetical protein
VISQSGRALLHDVMPDALEEFDTSAEMLAFTYQPGTYKGLIAAIVPQKEYVNLMLSKNVLGKGLCGLGGLPWSASWGGCQAACHQADHGPLDHRLGVFGEPFVVVVEASAADQPGQRALHHPAAGQDLEGVLSVGSFHDLPGDSEEPAGELHAPPGVAAVGPYQRDRGHSDARLVEHQPDNVKERSLL